MHSVSKQKDCPGQKALGEFFSLMVDGSGSLGCRIFGRLLPVRIVRKRGAIRHQSAARGDISFNQRKIPPQLAR
jgi:hypothetical protein